MKILSVFRRLFQRDKINDERFWGASLSQITNSGVVFTAEKAETCAAVYRSVRFLSETVAKLPLLLYKRTGDGRTRDTKHPLYKLLHNKPNQWQTSFEFREMMMGHVLLRGNAYAYKKYNLKTGDISELVPLNPTRVQPILLDSGEMKYEFTNNKGVRIVLPGDDVFHLRGPSPDGVVGISCIAYAKESIGLSLAAEEFGARTFLNDAQPAGSLEHPGELGEEGLKNLRQSLKENHGGVENARKWLILEEGMKWTKIGMSADDTQFIQTREFQIEEICRWFGVPPHKIGYMKHATFSNIEHQALEFVIDSLLPWLTRWEQAIGARLFDDAERETHYVEFLVDALLRGDLQSRYQSYAIGRQWGWLSADDVRRLENLDPLPEQQGEKYLIPMNMVDAKRLDEVIDKQVAKPEPKPVLDPSKEPPAQSTDNQSSRTLTGLTEFKPVLLQTVERYVERVQKSKKPFEEHVPVIREGLAPVVNGILMLNSDDEIEKLGNDVLETYIQNGLRREDLNINSKVEFLLQEIQRVLVTQSNSANV